MKVYFENIYAHIGYLLYALAAEHGKLLTVEYDTLKRIIDRHWVPGMKDHYRSEMDLLQQIHTGVHNAYVTSMNGYQSFSFFENYYLVNKIPFGRSLREKIIVCANAIVETFSRNGHTSVLIKQLQSLLELSPPLPGMNAVRLSNS